MSRTLQAVIDENQGLTGEQMIPSLHQCLQQNYPGLQLRWSRVYGRRRWAHIYGGSEIFSLNPLRVELGADYGLYIDNPELIPPADRDYIISLLQVALSRKPVP